MNDRALILFLKKPEKGKVKTRLAQTLGDELVLELYNQFVADILETCGEVDADTIIALSFENGQIDEPGFSDEFKCIEQRGKDLGERMYNALMETADLGYKDIVLIGSDIPDIPVGLIQDAFDKLHSSDVVLGPSKDGGYYLIGFNRDKLNPAVFDGIIWSTPRVLDSTVEVLKTLGFAWNFLIPWLDIDDLNDLRNYYKNNEHKKVQSNTMLYISRNRDAIFKNS